MAYIKQISVDTNWLDSIDGMTVAAAIEYLSTLNPEHVLSYGLEGDTHGCNVTACLTYDVPMSNEEILAQLEKHYGREIKLYEDARDKHLLEGRMERVSSCARQLEVLYSKLDEARAMYK